MRQKLDTAALLGSRICHDLISPLGAIGNGVELLGLSGATAGPELALISESVGNATARIRFFRVAFGMASADQRIGQPEITSILNDLWRGNRLKPDWQAPGDQPRAEVKLVFLLLLCVENAMPWGGRVTIGHSAGRWQITALAEKLRVNEALWASLIAPADSEGPVTPSEVQFALVPGEMRAQGKQLETSIGLAAITLTF